MKKKRKFTVKKRKVMFSKGPIHLVDCLVSTHGGPTLSRQILEHPGSVVIIPKVDKNKYILIRQFRFAARDWLWEWPAGGVEKGESLRYAAARELTEEIGYRPKKLKKIVSFFPSPGVSAEVMNVFLAEDLYPEQGEQDEDEDIECREFTLTEIGKMIKSGKISDAKTILGYFYLKRQL